MAKKKASKKTVPAKAAKARSRTTAKKSAGARSAAPKVAAGRGKKVVIEGVPPMEAGCSALAALHSALQALDSNVPYEILSVAGGEAFRLYVQLDRMRHAGSHGERSLAGVRIASTWFATHNVLEETCRVLGIRGRVVHLAKKPAATRLKTLWRDIEQSLRAGRPVPACGVPGSFEHEWCLITGVDPPANRVFLRDATHRAEFYAQGPRGAAWQGWMPGVEERPWMPHLLITAVPKRLPSEQKLAELVIRRAVAAGRETFVAPSWASGLAAYQVWILQLGQDVWHAEAGHHLREPALANAWLLSNSFAGRRAAGRFFEEVARLYAGKKNRAVHRAAKLYTASAGALHSAMGLFPNWGHGYEEPELRQRQIGLLTIAEAAEREAVTRLASAFDL
jgi:hypothetical protein